MVEVSPVSQTFVMFVSVSQYYKRIAGILFMYSFLQELGGRFSADNRTLKSIMSLVPLVMVGLADADSLAEDLLFWEKYLSFPLALKGMICPFTFKCEKVMDIV